MLDDIFFRDIRKRYDTPVFVLDRQVIRSAHQQLKALLPQVDIHYMVKANPHPTVLAEIVSLGCGVVVSTATELAMVRDAAGDTGFGIVGPHLDSRLLRDTSGRCRYVSVNSTAGARELSGLSFSGMVLLRVASHHFTPRKFGCDDVSELVHLLGELGVTTDGIHVHVGTNIEEPTVWRDAVDRVRQIDQPVRNIGGGLPPPSWLEEADSSLLAYLEAPDPSWSFIEPGRYLVADCAVCACRVTAVERDRVFIDVASNALPPLGSTRYVVRALVRTSEVVLPGAQGRQFHIFDNGCMDIQYLPPWVADVPPEKGDMIIIGRCGAYTYSLWSEFGGSKPPMIIQDNVL